MLTAFLLGVALAFWRQIIAVLVVLTVVSFLWKGCETVWRVFSPEKVYVREMEVVREGNTQYLSFVLMNDHQNRIVRDVHFTCGGRDTMKSPVVVWAQRQENARSYVRHWGWDEKFRYTYEDIDASKCRVKYSTIKLGKNNV